MKNPNKNYKIMEKEFIPYEEALALKELGFDEPCRDHWERGTDGYGWGLFTSGDYLTYKDLTPEYKDDENNICGEFSAPLYQQAFRWFRETHNLYGIIIPTITMYWTFKTTTVVYGMVEVPPYNHVDAYDYSSYNEAELACLRKLIEIVNEK